MPGVDIIFEAAPSLKYAQVVYLYSASGLDDGGDPDAFMSKFVGINRLWLEDDVFRRFSWSFLRRESARELEDISVAGLYSTPTGVMNDSVEDL